MGDAAAKGAARANGVVPNVAHDHRQKPAQWTVNHRAMEGRMPDASSDAKPTIVDSKSSQRFHPIDVNEMGWPRQSERHDGHKALATCQDTSIERRNFSQKGHRFINRSRCMVSEGSSLHLRPVQASRHSHRHLPDLDSQKCPLKP